MTNIDISHLSDEKKITLYRLLEEKKRRGMEDPIGDAFAKMYDWQKSFIADTATYKSMCLMAANQIGKTFTGCTIVAAHLTGNYPVGWEGHKFLRPTVIWVLGHSMEKTKNLSQKQLFGDYLQYFKGGLVTPDKIVAHESAGGTPNAMRSVTVKHVTGGHSVVQFWSYSQGGNVLMGDIIDFFHIDEEPLDPGIYTQVLTRTLNGDMGAGGRGILTFTPEHGLTPLVAKFTDEPAPSEKMVRYGWDDAPHISEVVKEAMLSVYPAHERDMRTKGIPMLGTGRIYDLDENSLVVEPFEIPGHWWSIGGMDFGYDHPQSQVVLVEDRDNGIFYVTRSWKASKVSAVDAFQVVKRWGPLNRIAWPSDGLIHEKGRRDAATQMSHYKDAGFNMLSAHATWHDGGNSVEQGIIEIRDLMHRGQFKIFKGQNDLLKEIQIYRRGKDYRVVKSNDDLLDAIRYAYMMRRYSTQVSKLGAPAKKLVFKGWS